ncbi:MAG: DNA internalization-related competence protein ComEC/Rec2 [Ardenticatenaceae bacterium]|nr:DNA internalization-related competence protein ComEC/Rec2 [Ardenticatenaceae bacterium]
MPPLIPFTLAWLLGLVVDAWQPLPLSAWLALGSVAALVALLIRRRARSPGPAGPALLASLALGALALGGARHAVVRPVMDASTLAAFNDQGEPVTVTGVVVAYPEVSGTRARLRVSAHSLHLADGREQIVHGRLLATVSRYPEWHYGDEVRLRGQLETPPVFEDFSYRDYLARQGIFSLLTRARGERLRAGLGSPLFAALYVLRDRARTVIASMLPEPHAALLTGILLGIDDGIPKEVLAAFNTTGTTHILVISGANFAVIAGVLTLLAARIAGPRQGAWLAIAGIALYALLVGGEPAVLRAAVMGALYVMARGLGRETMALNSLGVAVLLLTALDPFTLWDLGFQLSTLATLALILFVPGLTQRVERVLAPLGPRRAVVMGLLNEALIVTLAAQLTTTPLVVAVFGRLSLISLVTNLLILPVQSWLMLSGGLATLAGLLWLPLGRLLALGPWLALGWTLAMVEWTARVPAASVDIFGFRGPWLLGYYTVLFGTAIWRRGWRPPAPLLGWLRRLRRPAAMPALLAAAALVALLPWLAWRLGPDGRLHLDVLDVGQGDAILIVTPGGQQIVVDGGPDPQRLLARLGLHLPPWDRHLELVVLTHPDADHLGGLPELLARYQVAQVLRPDIEGETTLFAEWQTRLSREGAVVTRAQRGQVIALEPGLRLEVLHPGSRPVGEGTNNDAIVLRLRYRHFCALLTADIEAPAEQVLVAEGLDRCALLKVAHHGSATSSTDGLLAVVRPAVALISVGTDNGFGHPNTEVLARLEHAGARVLRTDQLGTIELISDGEHLWLHTRR